MIRAVDHIRYIPVIVGSVCCYDWYRVNYDCGKL